MTHCQKNTTFRQGDSIVLVFWNLPIDRADYTLNFRLFNLETNTPITETLKVKTLGNSQVLIPLSKEFTNEIPIARGESRAAYGIDLKITFPVGDTDTSVTTLIPGNNPYDTIPTVTILPSFSGSTVNNNSNSGSFVYFIQALKNDLNSEVNARIEAVNSLQSQITTNAEGLESESARAQETEANILSTLSVAISTETSNRETAIENIKAQVTSLPTANGISSNFSLLGVGSVEQPLDVVESLFAPDFKNGIAGIQALGTRKQVTSDTLVKAVLTASSGLSGTATCAIIIEREVVNDLGVSTFEPVLGIMDWNPSWSSRRGAVDVAQTPTANELMILEATVPALLYYTLISVNAANFASCVEYPLLYGTLKRRVSLEP